MKTYKGKKYLLHWENNPAHWNDDIEDIKKIRDDVIEEDGEYYTIVYAHFTGTFGIVDCTCDLNNGDFYPINVYLLEDYDFEDED